MSGKACEFAKTHDWTQGALARDKDGEKCDHYEDVAASFCTMGFIYCAYGEHSREGFKAMTELGEYLDLQCDGVTIPGWNDDPERTKEQVIEALCKAGI